MKAKDLMQFDWVLLGKKKLRCKGVSSHTNDIFLEDGTLTNVMNLSPIPITPEILEKNGWFYPPKSIWMKLSNPFRELWGSWHTDGTLWLYPSSDCDKYDNFAEIHYVHELQHALRLCGIEKEIVL